MSGEGHQLGQNVAIGSDGDVYVQGEFENTMKFGSAELISADEHGSLFVARLSRVGQLSWSRKIDGFSDRRWAGMALTSSGEPVLLGSFSGIVELGTSTLTTNGGPDVFLVKLVP
ncbi:hypothetical protein BE08_19220 [Sorangium cellulosum]|uniref:Uncharacterized protein n=1 Tax=Sorangium cellulosum TaxID=56 RepID=A0A150PEW7_SORCE|nr:hypothetical protein BE08_19220 [Sorangium cellulosum]